MTHLDGITDEQTMICKQLFAGHVLGSRPVVKRKKIASNDNIMFLKT